MKYEEFKKAVVEAMKKELGEEYANHTYRFEMIKKSGCEYEALVIQSRGTGCIVSPLLNITEGYQKLTDGVRFEKIIESYVKIQTAAQPPVPNFSKEDLLVYDRAKDNIFPRLINYEANKSYLEDKVYTKIEDLAMLYEVRLMLNERGGASAAVTEGLLSTWGVSRMDIHVQSLNNIDKEKPFFANISDYLFTPDGKDGIEIEDANSNDYIAPFFILTNRYKCKGASIVLSDPIMKRVVNTLGEVYIIPSSVDEVLVVPKDSVDTDVNSLREMVCTVNGEAVEPKDRLSDNVYTWTEENGLQLA